MSYLNRTWERFDYQSALDAAIDKLPRAQRDAVRAVIVDQKPLPEAEADALTD